MKKVLKLMMQILMELGIVFLALMIGRVWGENQMEQEETVIQKENDKFDLKMPGEVEKQVVTTKDIESELREIQELTTFAEEYKVCLGKDENRYFLDKLKIIGTTNSIEITCKGIAKVGYEVSDISVNVAEDKIFIALPEPKLNDNYVIWDTVECSEKNNILNPLEFSQYQDMIGDIEEIGLVDAECNGIYEKAEENAKKVISGFLAKYTDYKVVFM